MEEIVWIEETGCSVEVEKTTASGLWIRRIPRLLGFARSEEGTTTFGGNRMAAVVAGHQMLGVIRSNL